MKKLGFAIASATAVLLSACASSDEVWKTGELMTFTSKHTALELAMCLDKNADTFASGMWRSKIVTSAEPYEIVVRNGGGPSIYVVAQVRTAPSGGSVADIRFDTMYAKKAYDHMTKGCS